MILKKTISFPLVLVVLVSFSASSCSLATNGSAGGAVKPTSLRGKEPACKKGHIKMPCPVFKETWRRIKACNRWPAHCKKREALAAQKERATCQRDAQRCAVRLHACQKARNSLSKPCPKCPKKKFWLGFLAGSLSVLAVGTLLAVFVFIPR